jgi:enoyl-CoA hydratase/carnithine racemase
VLDLDPADAKTMIVLARVLVKTNRCEEAASLIRRAREADKGPSPEGLYFAHFIPPEFALYEAKEEIAHEAAADPERAALAYFEEHLKPKSASSLRHAVKAARLDYVARVKDKIRAVERLYLDELMATHDAVAGLEAFIAKRSPKWQHR